MTLDLGPLDDPVDPVAAAAIERRRQHQRHTPTPDQQARLQAARAAWHADPINALHRDRLLRLSNERKRLEHMRRLGLIE
jgi:hypothetical protein